MADELFPVFDIPIRDDEDEDGVYPEEYFWPGPMFDFEKGDFSMNGANQVIIADGNDEYMLWCMKCIRTQIGSCLCYPEFGIDLDGSLQETSHEAIEAALQKTITDGLMRNPRTDRIHDFKITFNGDTIDVFFIVEPKGLPAFDMTLQIVE